MNISDIIGGSFQMTAGPAGLLAGDLVEMGPDGKGYTVKTTDNAAVANPGNIVSQTALTQGYGGAAYPSPLPVVRDSAGNTYLLRANDSSGNGLVLRKFDSAGNSLATVAIDTGATNGDPMTTARIALLPNGNVIVGYCAQSPVYPTFAIYDYHLVQVVAPTTIDSGASVTISGFLPFNMVVLSGGNVAFTYVQSGPLLRMAVYSSAGSVVSAPATIDSGAGAANPNMVALSSGGFAVAWTNSANTRYAIYSSTGAVVLAVTNINAIANTKSIYVSVMTGFFAVLCSSGSNLWSLYVFNNAGAQQGATYTLSQTVVLNPNSSWALLSLTNDGASFWFAAIVSTGMYLVSVTTGGVGATYHPVTSGLSSPLCLQLATDGNGYLVAAWGVNSAAASNYVVIATASPSTTFTAATTWGTAPSSNGPQNMALLAIGDFAFLSYYDQNNGSISTFFAVIKYANSAIEGVCVAAAVGGAMASVQPQRMGGGVAAFGVNPLAGSLTKTFNHLSTSGSNLTGNKGVMTSNGVTLQGVA